MLLRYVPDLVKDEFVNFGIIVISQQEPESASIRFTRDWRRVQCLDPGADVEMLQALEADIRRKLSQANDRQTLLELMQSSFSGAIQLSPAQACQAESVQQEIEELARMYLEPSPLSAELEAGTSRMASRGRQVILQRMRGAFEQAGVWDIMRKKISIADYSGTGDPLKIDCGYQPNGTVKMFHAVSLSKEIDSAKALAFSYPSLVEGIARQEKKVAWLTAVVEDDLDRQNVSIAFGFDILKQANISVAPLARVAELAESARAELRL